jgi:hypothetical protein
VLEKMPPSLFGQLASLSPQARLDAELDRKQLAAALGPVVPPPGAATSPLSGFVSTARPLAGVTRDGWAGPASGLLKRSLAPLTENAR